MVYTQDRWHRSMLKCFLETMAVGYEVSHAVPPKLPAVGSGDLVRANMHEHEASGVPAVRAKIAGTSRSYWCSFWKSLGCLPWTIFFTELEPVLRSSYTV